MLIETVAAVIRDAQGRMLLVRKQGSEIFIQPGGKREPGEVSLATLARELREELGVELQTGSAVRLGCFEDIAVHEAGARVRAEVFAVEVRGEPCAGAEIAGLAWVDPCAPGALRIAPLSRNQLLPAICARERVGAEGGAVALPPMSAIQPSASEFDQALAALRRGEAIGLPTETVYGLAADALDPAAVSRIFALKGRPADHPLIVHLPPEARLEDWAAEVPDTARRLAAAFWPGPLTLILPRHARVPDAVTGGQDTVGLRMPSHPVAQALLSAFGSGLAAPSANRFGRISPTRAAHVREEFGEAVPVVLDGGDSAVGIESSIVDLSGTEPRILRPGSIGRAAIEAVIGPVAEGAASASPRVSGSLEQHYAPRTPTRLFERAGLAPAADTLTLALGALPEGTRGIALPAEPSAYAQGLYAALRELDAQGASLIRVEQPPLSTEWTAVLDRLRRAAAAGDAA